MWLSCRSLFPGVQLISRAMKNVAAACAFLIANFRAVSIQPIWLRSSVVPTGCLTALGRTDVLRADVR